MLRGKLVLVVGVLVTAAIPEVVLAETCSLYQKYVKDDGAGTLCAAQNGYFETTPAPGSGTFYARRVPRCEATGLDFFCGGPNWVRSLDGTQAFYHVDPVPTSTRWVIAFQGGGACGKMSGTTTAVENCADGFAFGGTVANHGYFDENLEDSTEMTSRHASGNYTVPNQKTGFGILSPNGSNPFADYNRVLVNKSSFDRFMGNRTAPAEPYNGDDVVLYFHGRRIISSMIKDLARRSGAFSAGDEVVPDFSNATEVIVVGESGGGGGLIMNMQGIKAKILNAAPGAEVRFVVASRMIPWLEAEAHFDNDPGNGGLWNDNYAGDSDLTTDPGFPPNPVTVTNEYNADTFHPGGVTRNLLDSWGDHASVSDLYLDASCLAAHPTAEWKCFDEGHVALNHMDEDVFFYQSLLDAVHGNNPITWIPTSDGLDVESLYGGFFFDPPLSRRFLKEKSERVVYTIDQMWSGHGGAGVLGFYAPDYDNHTAVYTSAFWTDTVDVAGLGAQSFASYLEFWLGQTFTMGAVADTCTTEKFQGGGWVDGYFGGGGDPACP